MFVIEFGLMMIFVNCIIIIIIIKNIHGDNEHEQNETNSHEEGWL
jgi:hypothetical protein